MIDRLCECGHSRSAHARAMLRCQCVNVLNDRFDEQCDCDLFRDGVSWTKPIANVDTTATRAVHDQPPPKAEDVSKPAVWPLVIVDMCERDRVGRARYGTPLQPNNGRDALKDAYQEALDLAAYLRQAIYERDGK
jgi:hypothetical protein